MKEKRSGSLSGTILYLTAVPFSLASKKGEARYRMVPCRAGWNRTIFKGFGDPYSTGKLRPFTMFRAYFGPHFVMTKLRPYVVGTQAMLTALQSMFELNYILKLASSKPNLLR